MKDLERFLYDTPTPKVKVTIFRQNLRRSLLSSGRFVKEGFKTHGLLFFAPTALAALLALVVIMFVINPEIPFGFHNTISPDRNSPDFKQAEVRKNNPENGTPSGIMTNWIEQLQQSTEADLDKAFVRYLAQERDQIDPGTIQSIGKTKLLAVTQYQLNNGQRVLVYTQLPDEQISNFRAY